MRRMQVQRKVVSSAVSGTVLSILAVVIMPTLLLCYSLCMLLCTVDSKKNVGRWRVLKDGDGQHGRINNKPTLASRTGKAQ